MVRKHILTPEGYQQLKNELDDLKKNVRPDFLKQMKEARELGDLRENGAYHAARSKLAMVQGRIDELEHILQNSLVQELNQKSDVAHIGSKITISADGVERTFILVSEHESDLETGKISVESPLGTVLSGAKVGQIVEFNAPRGIIKYRVESVV